MRHFPPQRDSITRVPYIQVSLAQLTQVTKGQAELFHLHGRIHFTFQLIKPKPYRLSFHSKHPLQILRDIGSVDRHITHQLGSSPALDFAPYPLSIECKALISPVLDLPSPRLLQPLHSSMMSYFHAPPSMSAVYDMSPLSSASTSSCGANCPCRTVSSVSSTTPILARVQLYPNTQNANASPSSPDASNEDLLEDSTMPNDDPSRQDFDFDDVFDDNKEASHTTNDEVEAGGGLTKREKSQTDFSFSHYSGYIKGTGSTRLVRMKSGLLKSRHVRVKSGSRRAG